MNCAIIFLVTIIYTLCKPECRKVLQPYSMEVFHGWGDYLKVSCPATIMICAEWWACELLIVMAGFLGTLDTAALTVVVSMQFFCFTIAKGF